MLVHHLLPAGWQPADSPVIHDLDGLVLVAPTSALVPRPARDGPAERRARLREAIERRYTSPD